MVRNGIKGIKLYSLGDNSVENPDGLSDEGANPLCNDRKAGACVSLLN